MYWTKPLMDTPFFPSWLPRFNPMGPRLAQTFNTVRAYTLSQLEDRLGRHLPQSLFPKAPAQANSRDRIYTRPRTFWSMLWQAFNPKASGREVVRQLQALFLLEDGPRLSEEDGAYCRAKARLPLSQFPKALAATAQAADKLAPALTLLQGRPLKIADGSTLTAPDTPQKPQSLSARTDAPSQLPHDARDGALFPAQRGHPQRGHGRFAHR